ncbi:MAG: nicotinate-nucleotide adenylyltransferase [Pseudomonadota bacterium]
MITRRIGLLGGSFNPAHDGHRDISLMALEKLALDAVWWLVTPGNPLKEKSIYAPFSERMKQARAVADHADIVVSDFENRHGLQYTVDTLERLQTLNPDMRFVWLMGADSLENFHLWRDWRRITNAVPIAVFNRPGYEADALASTAGKTLAPLRLEDQDADRLADADPPVWIFFKDADNPASSTALRRRQADPK